MPFAPDEPKKSRFVPDQAEPKEKVEKKEPTDRAARTFEQFVGGTALGAVAPELLQYGAAPAVTTLGTALGLPEVAIPAGRGLYALGGLMKTQRAAGAMAGGISGAGGEVAAQLSEAAGQSPAAQEAWRLAAGTVTPEVGTIVGFISKKVANAFVPGAGTTVSGVANAIKADLEKYGVPEASLSSQQKRYIQEVANRITGGATREAGIEAMSYLERGAQDIVNTHNYRARDLQNQADLLIKEATAAAEVGTAEAAQRVDALFRQFNETSVSLRNAAEARAKRIEENGGILAVGKPSNEARRILDDAKAQAARIRQTTEAQIERLRSVAEKARTTGASRLGRAKEAVSGVGRAMRPTEVGQAIRERAQTVMDRLKQAREKNVQSYKKAAFGEAAAKEQAKQSVQQTQSYADAVALVDSEIKSAGGLTDLSAPLNKIRYALTGEFENPAGEIVRRPVTFENLEVLRRFLRDRAWGMSVEGYDAISKIQAGKLADAVENVQKEFSPGFERYLKQYSDDSKPLKDFQTSLGQAVVGKEDFDMGRYAIDPATLGAKFFKTERGVDELLTLLGGDAAAVNDIARGFVADKLADADAKAISKFIKDNRDWIGRFPQLEAELRTAGDRLAQAERVSGKREKLSTVLRGAVPGVKTAAERELGVVFRTRDEALKEAAGRLRTEAEERVAGAEPKVRKTAEQIAREAEERGRAGVKAAEAEAAPLRKEAERLSAEGQRIADQIRGKSFPAQRAREIILSGDRELWAEVGPIIRSDENAMRSFADAVQFIIGERAATAPRNAVRDWAEKVRPAIEEHGLMDARQLARLDAEIDQINRTIEGPGKITAIQRLVRNALITEGARPIATMVEPFDPIRTLTKGRR